MLKKEKLLVGFSLLLIIYAIYYGLGTLPFRSDDGLRGLVAFEMEQTGEYIVPHLWGEYYYNKPPLFNWFIVASVKIIGDWSNFSIRFATATSLLLFGVLIFLFLKKHYQNWKVPFITAVASITTATILYDDAMVAEIDITFSVMVYGIFMSIFIWHDKNKWKMYVVAYIFAALAFLMKGFPAIIFIGFTLFFWMLWKKRFKQLFSLQHVVGALVFLLIVGGYYAAYTSRFSDGPMVMLKRLWTESTMRTVNNFTASTYIFNFFRFPLRLLSSLLPWSIFFLLLFQKGIKDKYKKNPILQFYLITFLGNIIIYWISPGNNLRYTLMFIPLLVGTLVHLYVELSEENRNVKLIDQILFYILPIIPLGLLVVLFMPNYYSGSVWALVIAILAYSCLLFFTAKDKKNIVLYFTIAVIGVKCVFNTSFLPLYAMSIKEKRFEKLVLEVAEKTKDEDLYIWDNCVVNADMILYLGRYRKEVVSRVRSLKKPNTLYIIDQNQEKNLIKEGFTITKRTEFESRKVGNKMFVVKLVHPESTN